MDKINNLKIQKKTESIYLKVYLSIKITNKKNNTKQIYKFDIL